MSRLNRDVQRNRGGEKGTVEPSQLSQRGSWGGDFRGSYAGSPAKRGSQDDLRTTVGEKVVLNEKSLRNKGEGKIFHVIKFAAGQKWFEGVIPHQDSIEEHKGNVRPRDVLVPERGTGPSGKKQFPLSRRKATSGEK